MSQQQPRRSDQPEQPIKYGDVFHLGGELARQPVRPGDAAMMQSAENLVIGQTQKGGAASVMQSAAARNERAGFVGHRDVTGEAGGVSVTEIDLPGLSVVSESVAGQKVAQFTVPKGSTLGEALAGESITVGEALEAAAIALGDKPVEQSDAAAVQAAEARATRLNGTLPGGVAGAAQSAADINARIVREENKITIGDVLTDAAERMVADKAVTREDAEGVVGAEIRNQADMKAIPGGVAETMVAAARLNQKNSSA